ncbi:PEP-CTERM sorting domain-containing protein [Aquincola sp. S2]|uniref:PEP-CTERM sorting domain-containing protein n=1 Tax=Pseudaquabacterium terrae TaxID=2732868 RepID=A0ABX2ETR3_9BURK|nr:PEP-CTERM sorting domain-containing protein [Aquabacterium terrae]NRF72033.1 PEP-CTERM sorting domain-containing protein [Aquabacterium terrae]
MNVLLPLVRSLCTVAALSAPLAASAGPSLLVNGSFEANVIAANSWSVLPSLTGWQGVPNIELRRQNAGLAQDGLQFVELDTFNNSGMRQDVATATGQHYTLSWYYSPRINLAAASNPIEVYWNDVLVTTNGGTGVGSNAHQWQLFSFDVIGTGGLDSLRFAAIGTSDSLGGSLDNVALVAVAAVPEPGALALVLAALGGLGLAGRRSKR